VLGERESGELLAKYSTMSLRSNLPVHQHVESDLFLQRDRFPDLRLDEAIVILGAELIVVQLAPRRPHFVWSAERSRWSSFGNGREIDL